MKRCYLAGPMRGYPQFNFPAFFEAAASLRERGYEVWSPAENDVHEDGFDPSKDHAQPMRHYMKRDLPAVLDADFVAVLPGWERSQGAMLEVTVARTCGIPVLDAATLEPVYEQFKSVLSDLLRRARPYVEAGSVPEESLLEEIDAALSEKVTVFQTSECHKPNSSGEA